MPVLLNHAVRKCLKDRFVRNISNKVIALCFVNNVNQNTILSELFCDTPANSSCAACYHSDLVFKFFHSCSTVIVLFNWLTEIAANRRKAVYIGDHHRILALKVTFAGYDDDISENELISIDARIIGFHA